MSFPNIIYGDYGDEKVAQSTKIGSLPLGQLLILPDGRKFRHARASTATAMSAGYLYQTNSIIAGTGYEKALTCTAAVGATSVVVTAPSGTGVTKDQYADGYLIVASSTGTGIGLVYKVASNNSAAEAATCTISLEKGDEIKVAIGGTTATVGLRNNPYDGLVVMTADTVYTGPVAGIPPVAVSAGFYHWVQRSGPVAIKTGATTLTIGAPVIAGTGTSAAGAVHLGLAGTVSEKHYSFLGAAMTIPLAQGFALIDLKLE